MSLSLDEKYEILFTHEEEFAYTLAKRVIKKPEVSVWMVLLPILFVHHAYRINQYKAGIKAFAKGIMSSKKKALDKSYKEAVTGEALLYDTQDYFPDVELKSLSDKALAQKQEKVIRLMEAHFNALFRAEGDSLGSLLKGAYGSPDRYRQYFNQLKDAEKSLNQYITEHVHDNEEAATVVLEIEKSCEALREEEIRYFFG
jgi:hypothetical protein